MNILDAIKDPHLFRPFLGDDLSTWKPWLTALRTLYGLPVHSRAGNRLVETCTGRLTVPPTGFDTALFLTGRRSGKSRTAAIIGAYEAVLAGHEKKLAKGEHGVVAICAPTKRQGRIVRDYIRAIFNTPLLEPEVVAETREGFNLRSGTCIEIMSGDFRSIRGYTLLAAAVDEICFFGLDEESKIKSDTELIRAIRPALATVRGKLVCISTPYARKGWCWTTFQKNHGNDGGKILVWNCPSRTMNETLPQSVVDDALAEDMQAAKSEYLGEFRDDVAAFLPREVIEKLVIPGRVELLPRDDTQYVAFADVSGGRGDDAALAIAHREKRMVVLDYVRRWKPPFNPHEVVRVMAEDMKRYRLRRVVGDNYAAEFVARAFDGSSIKYLKAEKPRSQLYLELLPRICSGEVQLLDNNLLINQLSALERRTRSGGKDIIDHPAGGHDDLANSVAGVCEVASTRLLRCGALA